MLWDKYSIPYPLRWVSYHIWFLYEKEVSIKGSKENVEIFDTAILIMAGLMIVLAVFSFSGEDMEILKKYSQV